MKKIIERADGLFHWQMEEGEATTLSMPFAKGSAQYRDLLSQGWELTSLPQGLIASRKAEAAKEKCREYLNKTDWYALRLLETGKAIPVGIAQKRAKARTEVD